jgi:hypothetical protein
MSPSTVEQEELRPAEVISQERLTLRGRAVLGVEGRVVDARIEAAHRAARHDAEQPADEGPPLLAQRGEADQELARGPLDQLFPLRLITRTTAGTNVTASTSVTERRWR